MVIVVMGVTGSGKSTVGVRLAESLGWTFCEGDDFHPAANVERMSRGIALTDDDRKPWLEALRARIQAALLADENLVLSCSALKASYREILRVDPEKIRFVHLKGDPKVIRERLQARQGHFAKDTLLASQFAALEEPSDGDALTLDIAASPDSIVKSIRQALRI